MQYRKGGFGSRKQDRKPHPPIPAGHFFCPSCSTIRAETDRSGRRRNACKRGASGNQAKSRANRKALGLSRR